MIKQFTLALAAAGLALTPAALADPEPRSTPELEAALAEGGERVVVDVLGAVCDFCALAMTRTFERRSEVAAADVDLDTKTLTVVFNPGEDLDDAAIADLIERSGYDLQGIRRGEG